MSVNRRFVLKSLVLSGAAGLAMGIPFRALSSTANGTHNSLPVMVLTNGTAIESAFLHGANTGNSRLQVQRVSSDLAFMLDFERQMRNSKAMRIIGLLDDTSATLIMAMAGSAGARVQWLGQHTAETGFSRHHLITTDSADGCTRQLSRQLQACGAGFSLHEEHHNNTMPARQLDGLGPTGNQSTQWATSIGFLLASLGTHPLMDAPLTTTASTPITGSFVSFSIEV